MRLIGTKTIAVPPGDTILEMIEDRNITQKELAIRLNMSEKTVCLLLKGDAPLTPETAARLEMVLGMPSSFWLGLESIYRTHLLQAKKELEEECQIDVMSHFQYPALMSKKWVKKTADGIERVQELRKFYEVADLGIVLDKGFCKFVGFRELKTLDKEEMLALAWCQKAKLEARAQNDSLQKINLMRLKKNLPGILQCVFDKTMDIEGLRKLLHECGVALVLLENLPGCGINTFSFEVEKKIVLGMVERKRSAAAFRRDLLRELGHILLGHHKLGRELTPSENHEAEDFAKVQLQGI